MRLREGLSATGDRRSMEWEDWPSRRPIFRSFRGLEQSWDRRKRPLSLAI